jgi:hypothetical protein
MYRVCAFQGITAPRSKTPIVHNAHFHRLLTFSPSLSVLKQFNASRKGVIELRPAQALYGELLLGGRTGHVGAKRILVVNINENRTKTPLRRHASIAQAT